MTDAAVVSGALGRLRRSGIREVMDLAARLDDVIHLELGEPDFPTPPHIVEAATRAVADGRVRYTLSRGTPALRELVSEKLARRNGISAGPHEVVVSSGGTTAVLVALMTLLDPGDGVLIPDPGWPSFELGATLLGAEPLRYRLNADDGHRPDLDEVAALAPRARVLVVNSPSNPTGAVLDRATLTELMSIAERHRLAVVSDEVYEDITFEREHVSAAALDHEAPVVTVFSFSKGYAMTGWRIGYAVATPTIVEAMVKAQEAVIACPSAVAQHAAQAALAGPYDGVLAMRDAYRERRDLAVAALRAAELEVVEPGGAFYAMVGVGAAGVDTFAFARRLLTEARVAVAPGETFGPAGAASVRLSLACDPAVLREGVARLAGVVAATPTPGREG
jgi:aspartate/methionine/tyrosine aminotransferase